MRQGRRMSEADKAVVRSCLEQVELGMAEAREVRTWWAQLSEERRQEWKDFAASVSAYRRSLNDYSRSLNDYSRGD